MNYIIFLIVRIVTLLLSALQLFMLGRAILSWLPFDDDSRLQRFLYATTEPVIAPVRSVMEKFGFLSGLPIDMSFFVTYLLLTIVSTLLPSVYI